MKAYESSFCLLVNDSKKGQPASAYITIKEAYHEGRFMFISSVDHNSFGSLEQKKIQ